MDSLKGEYETLVEEEYIFPSTQVEEEIIEGTDDEMDTQVDYPYLLGSRDGGRKRFRERDNAFRCYGQDSDEINATGSNESVRIDFEGESKENSSASTSNEDGTKIMEKRQIDVKDENKVDHFYGPNSVACCPKKCNSAVPKEFALKHRFNFMELEKREQDLIVCGHLSIHRRIPEMKDDYKQFNKEGKSSLSKTGEMKCQFSQYFFAGRPICRTLYFFLHNLTLKRYKALQAFYDENDLTERIHKSTRKTSSRKSVLTPLDIQGVVTFLTTYAKKVAIPLPGRMPQFRDAKVVKLPSSDTKIVVYEKYKEAAVSHRLNGKIMCRTAMWKIWNEFCPFITTMKPASDLCDLCRQNFLKLSRVAAISTEEREEALRFANEHLVVAKSQRELYNEQRERAKMAKIINFIWMLVVLSFDFAQGVAYPCSPQQVGSAYFKSGRKSSIFGINNEGTRVQTNILIDEEDTAGKGSNAVISMLDFYLNSIKAKEVQLFADNCVGQNKNNAVVQYLLWRVMTGKNEAITLNFMLTEHTKFSPDRNFGILKSKFSKLIVDCQEDLIDVVNASSPNKFNLAVPSKDPKTKKRNIHWARWDVYLQQSFKPIPGVTKYHHFTFHHSGEIKAKLFANSPEITLRHGSPPLDLKSCFPLEEITPEGLSAERQWYLYEEIRQLAIKEASQDLVAPKPAVPKPKKAKANKVSQETVVQDSTILKPKKGKAKKTCQDLVAPKPKKRKVNKASQDLVTLEPKQKKRKLNKK